jgi:hypothetical protein
MIAKPIYVLTAVAGIFLVGCLACATRQMGSIDCRFDRGGMIGQVGRVDLEDRVANRFDGSSGEGADEGARVDAGGDASAGEPVPSARDEGATDVLVGGGLTPDDIGAINALVRREDQHRIISIIWSGDRVEVSTGVSCDPQCIAGNLFLVRKTDGRWEIVERSAWKS